jgi:hypothetical protein
MKIVNQFSSLMTFLILLFWLSACTRERPAAQEGTVIPNVSPNAAAPTVAVPSSNTPLTPQAAPTQSGSGSRVVTLTPLDTECVPPNQDGALAPAPYENMPAVILDFLNQGGAPDQLDEYLYLQEMANQPIAVAVADLTGSGKNDLAVSIINPRSISTPPEGRLLLFTCRQSGFELAYIVSSPNFAGAPGIRYLQDLNADGQAEVIASMPVCGAHTCFENVLVLGWDGENITNRLAGETQDLPSPVIELADPQGDGIYQIAITSGGIGSVGAGPQRSTVRLFEYDPTAKIWEAGDDIPAPSNYRIHVLHDADQAAAGGDPEEALQLYQRVISDTTLEDWLDPAIERANLAAYACFKMFVLYTLLGREQFALIVKNELEQTTEFESSDRVYFDLVSAFQDGEGEGGVAQGCQQVRSFIESQAGRALENLGPASFGYGNPDYEPEDICPW